MPRRHPPDGRDTGPHWLRRPVLLAAAGLLLLCTAMLAAAVAAAARTPPPPEAAAPRVPSAPPALLRATAGGRKAALDRSRATMLGRTRTPGKGGPGDGPAEEAEAEAGREAAGAAPRVAACVGVMSRPITPRRAIVRSTWFPGDRAGLAALEAQGVYARFVVGQAGGGGDAAAVEAALAAEAAAHGDIMRVPALEAYDNLLLKVLAYYRVALATVDAAYYIKTDNDVYARLDRVPAAVGQWAADGARYVGCLFLGGQMMSAPSSVYYEPIGALLPGRKYFGYMSGGFYALSREAAGWLAARPDAQVRPLGCGDDCSVGLQMLSLPVRFVEDWRVCTYGCTNTSIVITDACNGLCKAEEAIPRIHADPACTGGGDGERAIGPLWAPANQRFVGKAAADAIECTHLKGGRLDRSACRQLSTK